MLGPGPVAAHLEHALGFAEAIGAIGAIGRRGDGLYLDLGSGGGVPGLVLATRWPASRWLFVDAHGRSADFLRGASLELDVGDRVSVIQARAEELGRDPEYRGAARLVTARSFGAPAVTAECAAPFLVEGGHLVVSEPPAQGEERWPEDGLALLKQRLERSLRSTSGHNFVIIEQVQGAPERFPRRTGQPKHRPLF
ncbi:MAG TPA: RsmG family class I SAM-dependent methyltransferase [Acidimicrobiales bacterium]|nr:RsmG family class I SAM-dependent methyltransferase [Acidimicrobiales bacterium]